MVKSKKSNNTPSVVRRYERVIGVLVKYGFEDMVAHPPLNRFAKLARWLAPMHDGVSGIKFSRYERIRMACEELGPTYIKFAQIASNRPDLLPDELLEELKKFQDHARPEKVSAILQVLEEEFHHPVEEVFEYFDPQPLASASMAQVHRARLIGGQDVVLKIQRPGIEDTIEGDIAVLNSLAGVMENHFPHMAAFQPLELVKMFEKSIRKELKFTLEMANIRRFEKNFVGNNHIYVPTAYPEYTTDRVLCMEYIQGFKITDLVSLERIGLTGPDLALKGINLYFQQIFDHGYFHADPHPGNLFILPNHKICFIDFGMMGTVSETDRELLGDLLLSVYNRDLEGLKRSIKRFSWNVELINEQDLEYDILEFFDQYSTITLEQVEGTEVMAMLNSLFFDYKVKIPSNLLLLMKALVIIEGVGLTLDPKYDLIVNIEPFVRRLMERKYSPEKVAKRLTGAMQNMVTLAANLPEDTREILKKIRKGKLHIQFEHQGLDPMLQKIEVVSNRIAFTLLLVALLVSSSLLVLADVAPHYHDVSVLGVGGFVISGVLVLRLIFSIMRHGNF